MRCLYCGKQLALLRRLTGGGEFCSETHKQSYHDEYNRLALSRLMQAQTRAEGPKADNVQSPAGPQPGLDERGWTTVNEVGQNRLNAPDETGAAAGRDSCLPPAPAGFLTARSAFPELAPRYAVPKPEAVEFSVQPPTPPSIPPASPNPIAASLPGAEFVKSEPWKPREFDVQKTPAQAMPLLDSPPKIVRDVSFAVEPCSTLVSLEFSPVTLDAIAPETGRQILQPAVEFHFSHKFPAFLPSLAAMPTRVACPLVAGVVHALKPPEPSEALELLSRCANATPYPDKPLLRYLRPIELRPALPPKAAPVIPFAHIAPLNPRPALPASTPIPIRPKVAFGAGASHMTRTVKITMATTIGLPNSASPEATRDNAQIAEGLGGRKHSAAGPVLFRETDSERSGKVWGTVQKYIKNLVGCVLLTALCLVAARDLSGETHRTTHQLFIYPESLTLADYRIELTPDLSTRITDLVFRAADPENYYAFQIFLWTGQSGRLRIKRYAVLNGEPGTTTALAVSGNYGVAPKIVLEVRGPEFRAYANGKLIESWADQRFTRGGFGFFSEGGAPPVKFVRILGLTSAAHR